MAGSDGDDTGPGTASDTVVIENSLPTAPVVKIRPNDPEPGEELRCRLESDASDLDQDPLVYEYSWWVNGQDSGQTDADLPEQTTSLGEEWSCYVSAYDGYGTGPAGQATTVVE